MSARADLRWIQRCPQHHTKLVIDDDTFWCYFDGGEPPSNLLRPSHEVVHPEIYDAWKRRVQTEGLPNDAAMPGDKGSQRKRTKKGPSMPIAIEVKKKKKTHTIERAKFRGPTGEGLFLRLLRVARNKGDRYELRWQHAPAFANLGKKGTVVGVAETAEAEAEAQEIFSKARASALSVGWEQAEISSGGSRGLVLKPIPAPKKKPGRSPRASRTK